MNLTTLLILIFFILVIILLLINKRLWNIKDKQFKMNQWLTMSGNQRNLYDQKEKIKTMERKKILLQEIRKEYKDFLKRNK